jgi:hypothetical protein
MRTKGTTIYRIGSSKHKLKKIAKTLKVPVCELLNFKD